MTVFEIMTTAEAAEYLRLSKRYLESLRAKGGGPHFVAFGRSVRYRCEDLDRWIESRVRRSTSDAGTNAV